MAKRDYVDLTMMLISHSAFRRDIRRLERAAEGATLDDSVRHKRIATGWGIFSKQLHIHHEGEDRELWPRMRRGAAGRGGLVSTLTELEAEHERIDPLLGGVDRALHDPKRDGAALASAVGALGDELDRHLRHEEAEGLPYVRETVTEPEWHGFIASQRKALGLAGAAEFFPWVLDGATAEDVARVQGIMPPPLRLIMKAVWNPMYRARGVW